MSGARNHKLDQGLTVAMSRFDAQVLIPYLRSRRSFAMTYEEGMAQSKVTPLQHARQPPSFLELQAQRRNVLRSTRPPIILKMLIN